MAVATVLFRRLRSFLDLIQSPAFFKELMRTLLAWGVLFIVGIWMVICQQWSDMRWVRRIQQIQQQQSEYSPLAGSTSSSSASDSAATPSPPWPAHLMIQDQFLEMLPLLKQAWISDKLVGSSVIICIIGCSVLATGWRQRLTLIRRIAWMVAILYFIRSITISVTTLPPSINTCEITVPQSMWQVIKATPDILAGNIGQCTDKIFSGHTAILVISTLFWLRYATHWAFIAYSVVHTFIGIMSVLTTRYHYTVDVVLGFLLTYFVHHVYYTALDQAIRQRDMVRGQALAWAKFRPSQHRAEDADEGVDTGGGLDCHDNYKMTVFVRNASANATQDAENASWRDYDSAVGIDISGRNTPMAQHNTQRNGLCQTVDIIDESLFVVRKRETSSATALSEAGETSSAIDHMVARTPVSQHSSSPRCCASNQGSSTAISPQHEIFIADSAYDVNQASSGGQRGSDDRALFLPRGNHDHTDDGLYRMPMLQQMQANSTSPHRLDVMGINRSFGSVLPAVVAWMDGLDIRYNTSA
ncbi:hypothetical protein BX661DRAFT_179901 [Kickxella alabastrina]|uniref:uncharacterized protein n=1 Tax=Kickxella alabastrina TaxID=61397 RepID=UPI00222062D4|nr:uncharacterized protein BX661DRAFT_179901 [Kickxella alabastrina]KAI7832154.1 hypothetical protein BX661DRAFT_179901 [Kickxella alabastrina]